LVFLPFFLAAALALALPFAVYAYFFPFTIGIVYFLFFAVLAAFLKSLDLGAPLEPGFLIFSPEPAAIRLRLACMLAYNPGFLGILVTI